MTPLLQRTPELDNGSSRSTRDIANAFVVADRDDLLDTRNVTSGKKLPSTKSQEVSICYVLPWVISLEDSLCN